MKLFKFENGDIALDHDEVALIKEFKAILRRDKDPKKCTAFAEFNYIYQMCDKQSVINQRGLNDKEAHLVAIDVTGLNIAYKPDDLVLAAMRRYEQFRPSPLEQIAKEIRGAFNTSHKVVKALRYKVESYIDKAEISGEDLQNATAALDRLLALADSIPKKMGSLKEIEDIVIKEDKGFDLQRGGEEILDSMDPDNALG